MADLINLLEKYSSDSLLRLILKRLININGNSNNELANKKTQVTAIFIVAILILVLIALLVGINLQRSNSEFKAESQNSMHLLGSREQYGLILQNCMDHVVVNAISTYGLSGSEDAISKAVELYLPACINESSEEQLSVHIPEASGINVLVTEGDIRTEFSEDIQFIGEETTYSFKDYIYNYDSVESLTTDGGEIKKGTVITSPDDKLTLLFGQDTKATDCETGQPVDYVSVSLIDRHFNDLQNSVLLTPVIYDGSPDCTFFDPAPSFELKLDDRDVYGIDPSSIMLLYFDSGMWKNYPGTYFDEDSNSVKGTIEHFTPFGAGTCGSDDTRTYFINMGELASDPFYRVTDADEHMLCEPYWWSGNRRTEINWEEYHPPLQGLHVLPEYMDGFSCDSSSFEELSIYTAKEGKPVYLLPEYCEGPGEDNPFFDDWDYDDIPENSYDRFYYNSDIWVVFDNEGQEAREDVITFLEQSRKFPYYFPLQEIGQMILDGVCKRENYLGVSLY